MFFLNRNKVVLLINEVLLLNERDEIMGILVVAVGITKRKRNE